MSDTHYIVEDWNDVGQALLEATLAGWKVTLLNWGGEDDKEGWSLDIQIGLEIDDPDFCETDPDPIKAVEKTYNKWKNSMTD